MRREVGLRVGIVVAALVAGAIVVAVKPAAAEPTPARRVDYRVGFLGAPCHPHVEWNDANLERLKALGFNCIQLNIAWGYRPNDEPLNLEDVVALPTGVAPMPGDTDRAPTRSAEKIAARSAELTKRIALCRKHGLRTIFHFGAPNVFYPPQDPDKPLDLCISDAATVERYRLLVRAFHEKFPGVDDLLCYTYDQHAWLCSEWGPCPRCHGIPLHERVTAFVNMMARTWHGLQKDGVLFWEPWELSAGETFRCMDDLDASCVGLALHSNIAEVQIAIAADRWFRNTVGKAARLGIPVLGEVWLGGATEEMEPFIHVPTPLATLRALRAVNASGPLKGIKEYYGLIPDREDPNLRMSGIFFADPDISDEAALTKLAEPYGPSAAKVAEYWKLVSMAVEIYPWDVSWLSREVGKSDPAHLLSAATLKGASWQTPSWQSTRRGLFIRTDQTTLPNHWLREDVQLRFEQTATLLDEALAAAAAARPEVPVALAEAFGKSVEEVTGLRRRVLAYAYHLRETNLADMIRNAEKVGSGNVERMWKELREVMVRDQENMGTAEPLAAAIALLDADRPAFLTTYFLPTGPTGKKEGWTITSE